jgi:hypothetical protein
MYDVLSNSLLPYNNMNGALTVILIHVCIDSSACPILICVDMLISYGTVHLQCTLYTYNNQ